MLKFFSYIIFFALSSNLAFSENKTVNSIIKQAIGDKSPRQSINKTSEQLAKDFLKSVGLTKGDNGDIFIAAGTAYVGVPKIRKNFQLKRRLLVSEAMLNAKKDFIEFVRTDMSAKDVITQPETPFTTEFDELVENTEMQVMDAFDNYVAALAKVDSAKAKKIENIEYETIAKEGIVAAIKRELPDYDTEALRKKVAKEDAKIAKELNDAITELNKSEQALNKVKAELKKIKGKLLKENTSVVETLSQMNVVGLFPIANFESWDGKQYQTTVICVWSTKEEKRARAIFAGQDIQFDPSDLSLNDYLENEDWSSSQGMRKFIDNKGNFWLLSISSAMIKGSSGSAMNKSKGLAQNNAKKQLVYSLYSDAKSKEKAKEKMQELAGKDENTVDVQTASNFSKELSQSFENLQIQGMSEKFDTQVTHPISGQKIYLSIFGISSKSVIKAKLMELSQARATMFMDRTNQKSKGVKVGINKAIDDNKKDPTSFNQGLKEGYSKANKKPEAINDNNTSGKSSSKPTKGGFQGGGTNSSAFK